MGSYDIQKLSVQMNSAPSQSQSMKQTQYLMSQNNSYDLNGIVVHYGSGMHYGHYWSLAKSSGVKGSLSTPKWIEFDDMKTKVVEDKEI